MIDILGKVCLNCQKGIYKEINIYEDIACNHCGDTSERYIKTIPEQERKSYYDAGYGEGKAAAVRVNQEKLENYLTNKIKQAISDFFYDVGPE